MKNIVVFRFESENSAEMLSHWMPYGLGPRQCIGMRFAQIEMKACIVNLLRQFEVRPANPSDAKPIDEEPSREAVDMSSMIETRDPLVNPIALIHQGPTLSPEGGVHVVLVKRVSCTDINESDQISLQDTHFSNESIVRRRG